VENFTLNSPENDSGGKKDFSNGSFGVRFKPPTNPDLYWFPDLRLKCPNEAAICAQVFEQGLDSTHEHYDVI
jgi:hypothetical protein